MQRKSQKDYVKILIEGISTMKNYLTVAIVFVVFATLFAYIPESKAPILKSNFSGEASIMNPSTPVADIVPVESSPALKDSLISLLEMTVDRDHDLSKGLDILETVPNTPANQKILLLYEAKITSRALDFEKAQQLLQTVDTPELALLKAAVLIAGTNRDKAGAYLHDLVENNPDGLIKSQALALLNIYHRYDRYRDADEGYLWTLFAQKLGDWGELEISKYLAEKAINRNPDYRDAWIIKGYDELRLKKPAAAEISLLTAYRLDPGNSHIQYLLGLTYFDLDLPNQSNQYLLYSKENGGVYHEVIHEKLAENAIKAEDFPLAAHYYESLLQESPKHEQALIRLIWLYAEKLNQLDKALVSAEQLVKYYPTNLNHLELLKAVREIQSKPSDQSVG
jgi:hypothetical protein